MTIYSLQKKSAEPGIFSINLITNQPINQTKMKIDRDTVDRVAALARLTFKEEEKTKIQEELSKILTMCEKLNELDTEGVEPLIFMSEEVNVFRDDEAFTTITKEEALKNAPQRDSDYIKVPKVLERGE